MSEIWVVLALAMTVEAIVEYIKTGIKSFSEDKKTAVTQGMAVIIAVILCIFARVDIYSFVGISFGENVIGCVLTGVVASRGANYLSDFAKKLFETQVYDN